MTPVLCLGDILKGEITGEMHRNLKNVALDHLWEGRLFIAKIRRERAGCLVCSQLGVYR